MTLRALAKRLGMSHQNLALIEAGSHTSFSDRTAMAIGEYLGIRLDEFVSERTPRRKLGMTGSIESGPLIQRHLPLLTWKQAGGWVTNRDVSTKDIETFPCPVSCSPDSFVLRVRGPSMEPVFKAEELIFVDPRIEPTDKRYVVAELAGADEPVLKQFIVEGSHRVLKSVNPAWPEPMIQVDETVKIVGVVIFRGSPV